MCSKMELEKLKERISQILEEKQQGFNASNIQKRIIINLQHIEPGQLFYCYRTDGFVLFENRHLIYLDEYDIKQRFKDLSSLGKYQNILKKLIEELSKFEDLKTRNKDKLMFTCPSVFDEYCPICSFTNINRFTLSFHNLENVDNLSPDIIESISELERFFEVVNLMHLTFRQVYLPAIKLDKKVNQTELNILNLSKQETELLLSTLVGHLKEQGISLSDINSFALSFSKTQISSTHRIGNDKPIYEFEIVDVDEENIRKDKENWFLIEKSKQELLRTNISSIVFKNKELDSTTINQLIQVYDSTLKELKSNIEELIYLID